MNKLVARGAGRWLNILKLYSWKFKSAVIVPHPSRDPCKRQVSDMELIYRNVVSIKFHIESWLAFEC